VRSIERHSGFITHSYAQYKGVHSFDAVQCNADFIKTAKTSSQYEMNTVP